MRPTVEEQLLGSCRILETVITPYVADPLARTILDNLIANLRMVTGALLKVPGFLRYDNAATLDLLIALRVVLPSGLVAQIDRAASENELVGEDAAACEERNQILRALLAEAVCQPGLTHEMRKSIESYMINRASRVPMRYVPTVSPGTP